MLGLAIARLRMIALAPPYYVGPFSVLASVAVIVRGALCLFFAKKTDA